MDTDFAAMAKARIVITRSGKVLKSNFGDVGDVLVVNDDSALAAMLAAQKVNATILKAGGLNPVDWWDPLIDAQRHLAAAIRDAATP